jgi:hypothetical protein
MSSVGYGGTEYGSHVLVEAGTKQEAIEIAVADEEKALGLEDANENGDKVWVNYVKMVKPEHRYIIQHYMTLEGQ